MWIPVMYCASTINVVYAHFLLVYCLLNFELKKNIVVLNFSTATSKSNIILLSITIIRAICCYFHHQNNSITIIKIIIVTANTASAIITFTITISITFMSHHHAM